MDFSLTSDFETALLNWGDDASLASESSKNVDNTVNQNTDNSSRRISAGMNTISEIQPKQDGSSQPMNNTTLPQKRTLPGISGPIDQEIYPAPFSNVPNVSVASSVSGGCNGFDWFQPGVGAFLPANYLSRVDTQMFPVLMSEKTSDAIPSNVHNASPRKSEPLQMDVSVSTATTTLRSLTNSNTNALPVQPQATSLPANLFRQQQQQAPMFSSNPLHLQQVGQNLAAPAADKSKEGKQHLMNNQNCNNGKSGVSEYIPVDAARPNSTAGVSSPDVNSYPGPLPNELRTGQQLFTKSDQPNSQKTSSEPSTQQTPAAATPQQGNSQTSPILLFDAPCELRLNFLQYQRLQASQDQNLYQYGMAVNGFHPQLNAQDNPPVSSNSKHRGSNSKKGGKDSAKERNEREQKRAQKITELIESLRMSMVKGGWKVEMKSKYHTLST